MDEIEKQQLRIKMDNGIDACKSILKDYPDDKGAKEALAIFERVKARLCLKERK